MGELHRDGMMSRMDTSLDPAFPLSRAGRRPVLGVATAVLVASFLVASLPVAPVAASEPFSINIYRSKAFVSQATKKLCVAGAMQTMLNITLPEQDYSGAFQKRIAGIARELSNGPTPGTEPLGWARGLEELGAGPYTVRVVKTRKEAVRLAAISLRQTRRPVGLLAWYGAHAWVMHGFVSDRDPALTRSFTVSAVYISDPWYPRVSTIWGPSNPPNTLVPVKRLPEDYKPWSRPTARYPDMDGRYVLVVPVPITVRSSLVPAGSPVAA
jgi:hypothetical protein